MPGNRLEVLVVVRMCHVPRGPGLDEPAATATDHSAGFNSGHPTLPTLVVGRGVAALAAWKLDPGWGRGPRGRLGRSRSLQESQRWR